MIFKGRGVFHIMIFAWLMLIGDGILILLELWFSRKNWNSGLYGQLSDTYYQKRFEKFKYLIINGFCAILLGIHSLNCFGILRSMKMPAPEILILLSMILFDLGVVIALAGAFPLMDQLIHRSSGMVQSQGFSVTVFFSLLITILNLFHFFCIKAVNNSLMMYFWILGILMLLIFDGSVCFILSQDRYDFGAPQKNKSDLYICMLVLVTILLLLVFLMMTVPEVENRAPFVFGTRMLEGHLPLPDAIFYTCLSFVTLSFGYFRPNNPCAMVTVTIIVLQLILTIIFTIIKFCGKVNPYQPERMPIVCTRKQDIFRDDGLYENEEVVWIDEKENCIVVKKKGFFGVRINYHYCYDGTEDLDALIRRIDDSIDLNLYFSDYTAEDFFGKRRMFKRSVRNSYCILTSGELDESQIRKCMDEQIEVRVIHGLGKNKA